MRRQGHDKGICSLRDEFGFSQLMWQCLTSISTEKRKETEAPSKRNKSLAAPYPRGKSEMEFRGAYPLDLGPGACVFLWRVLRSRLPLLLAEKGGPCLHPSAGDPSTHCKVLGTREGLKGTAFPLIETVMHSTKWTITQICQVRALFSSMLLSFGG